ncbi:MULTISPECIES: hypothetical protein [Burkholderia]|uniref:hypothetical protein n=1 Tax=Burkholderia TaxID=32008 RepID=UPI000751F1B6|nr:MULTISPECIES: hypothetical protein [Burkholderia]KVS72788.1 hypothetical protein WK41_14650 [Burkholderia cepacia]QEW85429.1 hypothetical protein E4F34_33000 [Burkholderia pseudomallei]
MTDSDFSELAARVDAVGQTMLRLIGHLEEQGCVDGVRLSQALRRFGTARRQLPDPIQARGGEVVLQMVQLLDEARSRR